MKIHHHLLILLITIITPLISACGEELIPTNVVGYNHTDKDIGNFTVNGQGGGFLQAHHGGGKFSCCIDIPKPWKPHYEVTVNWTDNHGESYKERVVEVPKYEKLGDFAVHFLRSGEVKVFVTILTPRHPDYPLKGSEAILGN